MIRQRYTKLPGSLGPFLGPDGKQLHNLQDTEQASRSAKEAGLVLSVSGDSAHTLAYVGSESMPINTAKFFPLRILSNRMTLTHARMAMLSAAVTGGSEGALYIYTAPGTLTMVAGSHAKFLFSGQEQQEVALVTEVHLMADTQYYVGTWNTSAANRNWLVAYQSVVNWNILSIPTCSCGGLPSSIELTKLTHNRGALGGSAHLKAMLEIVYLTSIAKEIL